MQVGKLTIPAFEKNQTGQVTATITVTNHIDQILAERGFISAADVRAVTLENVLVDTGHLVKPANGRYREARPARQWRN